MKSLSRESLLDSWHTGLHEKVGVFARGICGRSIQLETRATMRVYRLWKQFYCVSDVLSGGFCSCSRTAKALSIPGLRARKKSSYYGDVDSGRYLSLVKEVVSTSISSQTPASIENEDQCLYGSIVKSKPQVCRALKNPWPLLNDAKGILNAENVKGTTTRISLQIGSDHTSMPSVTKILQKTMSAQQAFYLKRWKKRKIAELGVEGFKEYSNSKLHFFPYGVFPTILFPNVILCPRKPECN